MMKRVAVYAFEGMSPFHLSVPCVVFADAASDFKVTVCSEPDAPLQTTAGFSIHTEHGLNAMDDADIIIIPSWHSPYQPPSNALINALKSANHRGALVVGLCLGSFALAAAGLLDRKRATTHWAYFEAFKSLFPNVVIDSDVLFVEEGNIVTSAGTAAGLDCCLQIVRNLKGSAATNDIARLLVVPPQRQGGQSQYISIPVPERGSDKRLAILLDEVLKSLNEPHSIDALAEKALMSRRTFTRRFQTITGRSFGQWLLSARLAHCQNLLESTALDIEHIATESGFNNATTLRHHFKNTFGVTPSVWRKMYRD
ncbi:AraC family transcriptional regulator [Grimontia sp. AD028]|uniref:GlxA family transcriptional regulator n=1 Tax=Grimontia sp. AD028 TaxID=1581149 RepID=UPI00061AC2D0|nr:helix-turn-helix domain-containing protein [Grimontia sp. AD028]KKD58418.1 AraC family transcriptional regulator [Grimontia sp. AD028]